MTGKAKTVEEAAQANWATMLASAMPAPRKPRKRPWVEDHHEYFRVGMPGHFYSEGPTITFSLTDGGNLEVGIPTDDGNADFTIPRRFAKRLVAWLKDKLEDDAK